MLKYRLIFGLLFSILIVGMIYLDGRLSANWPRGDWSAPPGMVVALGSIAVVIVALREMQRLLARQNVEISLRICSVAAILCMLWPWLEQVSVQVRDTHEKLLELSATAPAVAATDLRAIENSLWYALSHWFHTVKPHYLVPTILTASLIGAFVMHSRHRKIDGAMASAGGTLLAVVYLGVLPGFFLPICMTHSAWMLLAIICIVKSADIGAYATGHAIGRHKLIPWLSPGKTVEGFFGGLIFSGIVGAAITYFCHTFAWQQGLVAGVLLGAVGQVGDLLESLLKRDAGVKDSGHVPGFGGVLDLLDSPLLAAPVAYWILKLVSKSA